MKKRKEMRDRQIEHEEEQITIAAKEKQKKCQQTSQMEMVMPNVQDPFQFLHAATNEDIPRQPGRRKG